MEPASVNTGENDFFTLELSEETPVITLCPVKEEFNQAHQTAPSVSVTPDIKPKKPRRSRKVSPQTDEQVRAKKRKRDKSLSIPLPIVLPPICEVARNTLRDWSQQLNLSTDGQKVALYERIRWHAYHDQKVDIPATAKEAKLQTRFNKKGNKRLKPEENCNSMEREEETHVVEVLSTAQEAIMAAWSRISVKALQPRAANSCNIPARAETFLPKAAGERWCVVHGRVLSADTERWVRLQFHAGQIWVPDTARKMISLFLLPACVFPSPELEDNMLCPECVERNKKMMKTLMASRKSK
ncbi:developmental pluripotency-associated protein 2-like [Rhynchocyon petersi]